MHTFSTLVLYERHGRAAIGYRAEMIDQIEEWQKEAGL